MEKGTLTILLSYERGELSAEQLARVRALAPDKRIAVTEDRAEIEAMQRDELKIQKQLELQQEVEAQVARELENELKSAKVAETDET